MREHALGQSPEMPAERLQMSPKLARPSQPRAAHHQAKRSQPRETIQHFISREKRAKPTAWDHELQRPGWKRTGLGQVSAHRRNATAKWQKRKYHTNHKKGSMKEEEEKKRKCHVSCTSCMLYKMGFDIQSTLKNASFRG